MIRDAVVQALLEVGVTEEQISDDTHLQGDLELDSTETVQIALELKRRCGVEVKLEASDDLTVGDVCRLVEHAMEAARTTA